MKRHRLQIAEEECWGCRACELACRQEMEASSPCRALLRVREEGPGLGPSGPVFIYRLKVCLQCDEPPCEAACPAGAITKRADGLVILEEVACVGCQACIEACPEGAILFDERTQKARKCNLCHHRVDRGLLPACADNVCLAHCIAFQAEAEG